MMPIVPNWCEKCEFDERDGGEEPCIRCTVCGENEPTQYKPRKHPTNADRIRSMTDEELAAFMFTANGCPMWVSDYSCKEDKGCRGAKGACWLDWLKEEAVE